MSQLVRINPAAIRAAMAPRSLIRRRQINKVKRVFFTVIFGGLVAGLTIALPVLILVGFR